MTPDLEQFAEARRQLAVHQEAYRHLLQSTRAYKQERDRALGQLDRLHVAADLYLSSTEERHAERLEQLTDEIEKAQHHLALPRHGDDPEAGA
jgi:benzoyl-CoA reductase/2-hydroxyglutaryl-CoA dehydratase subunit BcrC/BadD/HgdB